MKNKPKPAKIAKVELEQLNEKIESDANNLREKYPEIAKMTVAEVVATNLFTVGLRQAITSYRVLDYYAFRSLRLNNTLEPENFRKEYIACMDKQSKMPYAKRIIVLAIGDDAYRRTVIQMMKNYDAYRRTVIQMMKNYDAIQNGEAVKNLDKLSL